MAIVHGGKEDVLDRDEGCSVKILVKFTFDTVLAEYAVCMVLVGAL